MSDFGPGRLDTAWLGTAAPDENPWLLTTTDPRAEGHRDAFLGNGYIGQRIGVGGDAANYPVAVGSTNASGCQIHGFWNDANLMTPPRWAILDYHCGLGRFALGVGRWDNYRQQLDMRKAILTTELDWTCEGRTTHLETTFFLSRTRPNLAVLRRAITPAFSGRVTIVDRLDGTCVTEARDWRVYDDPQSWAINHGARDSLPIALDARLGPRERRLVVASRTLIEGVDLGALQISGERGACSASRTISFHVEPGKTYVFTKLVALVTDADSPSPRCAAHTLIEGAALDPAKLQREHEQAWETLWRNRIEVPSGRLQAVLNATLYQLYANLRAGGRWSLGPTGLSGNAWEGRAFWDSDLWMFPGLCLLAPELGRGFAEYRWDTLDGARRNARAEGYAGAMFAWESAETGDETIPERIFHHQHHVNSDVALAQWWFGLISGDRDYLRTKAATIIIESARFWASYATYNAAQDRYEIRRVCCADEHAGIRDNNAYTSYSAVKVLRLAQAMCRLRGEEAPPEWEEIARKMWIPFDEHEQRYIEYEGYAGEGIKQADTALLVYPYELPMSEAVKRNIVDYYRTKYPKGNIMMAAAFDGIVDCELGRAERGWESFGKLLPHFREPYLLVSESPFNDCISFVTGLGGLLQLVLMGFAGIRIHGDGLRVAPCLPPDLPQLTIRGLHYAGTRFDLIIDRAGARVANASRPLTFKLTNAKGEDLPGEDG